MELDIVRLGASGEGVAKDGDGKIVFVKYALPSERVEVQVVSDKKNFSVAKLTKILTPAKTRVQPKCPYFGICGGCDLQHMDRQCESEFKLNSDSATISKISKQDISITKISTGERYNYRNKMVFPVVNIGGKTVVGMFEENSHKIVDIDYCFLAKPKINDFLKLSKNYFAGSRLLGYDWVTDSGDIMYLVARVSQENLLVTVVAKKHVDLKAFYETLTQSKMFKTVGLSLVLNKNSGQILNGEYTHLYGESHLHLQEFGINYDLDNRGFLQVNDEVKTMLYDFVCRQISHDDSVVDCYSGAGLLSAIISKVCKKVVGIEIVKSASESAVNLAKENGIKNVEFICGDVGQNIGKVLDTFKSNVVVLDPPRSGCDSTVLKTLIGKNSETLPNIQKIIYVSCNPSTLARDLSILSEKFKVQETQLFDIFACTSHVETVVVLTKK